MGGNSGRFITSIYTKQTNHLTFTKKLNTTRIREREELQWEI